LTKYLKAPKGQIVKSRA